VGRALLIIAFVAPLRVLVGGLVGPQPFALSFSRAETGDALRAAVWHLVPTPA
jgi:hypothetical protein